MGNKEHTVLRMSTLLKQTWEVWRQNILMFMLLMGSAIAAFFLMAITMNYVVAPHPAEVVLREVWQGMSVLQKLIVCLLFLIALGVQYRALAASAFATQEIWSGRKVRFWQAFGSVRRKQLRLFWIVLFASLITGPFGLIVGPILIFATAPGLPAAILEGKTALAALKRGDTLLKHDRGRIAFLVILWLGTAIAAVIVWVRFLMALGDKFGEPFPWYLKIVPSMGFWLILLIPQLYMIAFTLLFLERRQREIAGTVLVRTEGQV